MNAVSWYCTQYSRFSKFNSDLQKSLADLANAINSTVLRLSDGGLLVHSLFDFNLQLLSHALLFLSFASLAVQLSELAKAWNLAPVRHTAPGFVTSFSGAE